MTPIDPEQQRAFAAETVAKLRAAGHEAYWAGGCVRDQLLGKTPKDYDVATDATPHRIREIFGRRHTLPIGAAFGVIAVVGPAGSGTLEVATFRTDATYSDGRHPDAVAFSDARHDAQRRDFTINGLFFDPLAEQVLDYVGGQEDLRQGVVRAIGDPYARFAEDKLRLLRAVRFAATFNFTLAETTSAAIRDLARQITVVSAERIAQEMRRMLVDARRRRAVELLTEHGLLEALLPDVGRPGGAEAGWELGLTTLDGLAHASFPLALAVTLTAAAPDISPEEARRIGRGWRLSNEETGRVAWLIEHRGALDGAARQRWSRVQRILIQEGSGELLHWMAADRATRGLDAEDVVFCRGRLAWPAERLHPPPLLNGNDLQRARIPRGRLYQVLLDRTRDAQLDGEVSTPEEALAAAVRWAGEAEAGGGAGAPRESGQDGRRGLG